MVGDHSMTDVANANFSTFEGKIQAVSSRNPVRLGRDPGECHMSLFGAFRGTIRLPLDDRHSDIIA